MNIVMCLLVIFIHIASWTLPDMDRSSVKYVLLMLPWRLSAFVVQGFLFLSGVKLFSSKREFDYPRFIKGRLLKVYLPYLLWVCVYDAYFISIGWAEFSVKGFVSNLLLGTGSSHFYYVVIAMQFYLLMPLWRWLVLRVNGVLLAALSVLVTALVKAFVHFKYDDRVFFAYLCYFVLGAVVGANYERVAAAVKRFALPILAAALLFGGADAFFTYRYEVLGIWLRYFEVLHLFYCISAIFALLALSLLIFEKRGLPRLFALADRSTYLVYLSHVIVIYIVNGYIFTGDMLLQFLLRGVYTYVITFALCMGYTFVKERLYAGSKKA